MTQAAISVTTSLDGVTVAGTPTGVVHLRAPGLFIELRDPALSAAEVLDALAAACITASVNLASHG